MQVTDSDSELWTFLKRLVSQYCFVFIGDNIYVASLFCSSLCWEMLEVLSSKAATFMPKMSEYIVEYWIAILVRIIVPNYHACSSKGRKLIA